MRKQSLFVIVMLLTATAAQAAPLWCPSELKAGQDTCAGARVMALAFCEAEKAGAIREILTNAPGTPPSTVLLQATKQSIPCKEAAQVDYNSCMKQIPACSR